MSFENASITWGANQLSSMVKNNKIVFDNVIQRGYVWEQKRKSALIESMVLGVPIPDIFAKRYDDGSGKKSSNVYDIMDGKQRLSTIYQFINNKFSLTELPPITYYDEMTGKEETFDMSGMMFDELPEGLQEKIKNARISVIYFDNLTKYEERELFKRLNAGKPLSTKSRLLASCNNIEELLGIGSHEMFDEMMTKKAKENKDQVSLVMKIWCMMNQNINEVCFESKSFNPLIEKTEITESEKESMLEVLNLIKETHDTLIEIGNKKVAKKLYKETHMVSLVPYFNKAVKYAIDCEMMANWLVEFYDIEDNTSVSDLYNEACGSGSAKSKAIIVRNNELSKSYNEFFKSNYREEEEDDEDEVRYYEVKANVNKEDEEEKTSEVTE